MMYKYIHNDCLNKPISIYITYEDGEIDQTYYWIDDGDYFEFDEKQEGLDLKLPYIDDWWGESIIEPLTLVFDHDTWEPVSRDEQLELLYAQKAKIDKPLNN